MDNLRGVAIRNLGDYLIDAWLRGVITLAESREVFEMWYRRIDRRFKREEVGHVHP